MPSALPAPAFIPWSIHNENERRRFVEHRDRLFARCTPDEQRCLLVLAEWYASPWHRLLARPHVFDTYVSASLQLGFQRLRGVTLHPLRVAWIRAMAKIGHVLNAVERRIGAGLKRRCIGVLRSSVKQGHEDVLLGVVDFLRLLPLEVAAPHGNSPLQNRLTDLTAHCMASPRVSARRRMDAALRCIDRHGEPKNYHLPEGTTHLLKLCWPLLLELATEDMQAALHVVDQYAARQGGARGFTSLDLFDAPACVGRDAAGRFHPLCLLPACSAPGWACCSAGAGGGCVLPAARRMARRRWRRG